VRLVAKLEAEETLDHEAIKSCLEPGTTITPFEKNRKTASNPRDSERKK
jgi:hypothetical protein